MTQHQADHPKAGGPLGPPDALALGFRQRNRCSISGSGLGLGEFQVLGLGLGLGLVLGLVERQLMMRREVDNEVRLRIRVV